MYKSKGNAGFSLIELMIAVAIMGVFSSQMFMVFSSQKRVYTANERVLDVQEDTRILAIPEGLGVQYLKRRHSTLRLKWNIQPGSHCHRTS